MNYTQNERSAQTGFMRSSSLKNEIHLPKASQAVRPRVRTAVPPMAPQVPILLSGRPEYHSGRTNPSTMWVPMVVWMIRNIDAIHINGVYRGFMYLKKLY